MHYPIYLALTVANRDIKENYNNVAFLNGADSGEMYLHDILVINDISTEGVPILSLPFGIKIILTIIIITAFCLGTFFKYIMYRYSAKQNREGQYRPIDVLTLVAAILHHFTHLWLGLFFVAAFVTKDPLKDIIGHQFCQISYWIACYGLIYLTVGSFGIATYRILYIKKECLVKDIIGQKRLMIIILFLSVMISGAILFMFSYESTNQRTFLNTCNGLSSTHAQILIDYSLSLGDTHHTTNYLRKTSIATLILIQVVEFVICVWFFYFQYKHDNGSIKKLLEQEVTRDRNLKNITTFIGHIYCFLTKCVFYFLSMAFIYVAAEYSTQYQAVANIAKFIDFGLLSAVEVLTSPTLRRFMKQ